MAGKKASDLGDRFRRAAVREGASGGTPAVVPGLGADTAERTPAAETSRSAAGVPSGADRGEMRPPARTRQKGGVGRKAKVGLRPGTGRHRFTLDLDGVQHRYLKQLALDAQTDMASVVRVLISSLEEDPVLRNEVALRARGSADAGYGMGYGR